MKRLVLLGLLLLAFGCGNGGGESHSDKTPSPPPPEPPPIILPPPPEPPPPMVCLEWDAVIHPDLAGYKLYYGKVSEQYDVDVTVAEEETSVCIMDDTYFVEGGTYFFVATAFSEYEESDYSNEVEWNP